MAKKVCLTLTTLLAVFLGGCAPKEQRLEAEYYAALKKDLAAYAGADAVVAFREKSVFLERVKMLEKEGARIPAKDLYIWETARLGLLAEHLGKKEEAARLFRIASDNAKKTYPSEPESKTSEAALRAALDEMDTPDKFPWRRK